MVKGSSEWEKEQVGGLRFRRRKEWMRHVLTMWRRERIVSWYCVREVDGSIDSALH